MYNGKMETIYESEYMNLYDLQYREADTIIVPAEGRKIEWLH